jgi:hypothetical protein
MGEKIKEWIEKTFLSCLHCEKFLTLKKFVFQITKLLSTLMFNFYAIIPHCLFLFRQLIESSFWIETTFAIVNERKYYIVLNLPK